MLKMILNRLDEIVLYKPLSKNDITKILDIQIDSLNNRLLNKQITCELTNEAKQFIINNGYNPVYGARPLKRFIQRHVETEIAKVILGDNLSYGENIVVDYKDDKLKISHSKK